MGLLWSNGSSAKWSIGPLVCVGLSLGTIENLGAQGAIGDFGFDVTDPPGGVLPNGESANLPVEPGDLMLSLIESPTNMFAALMNEEAEVHWAQQTPFRGFYMKPWLPGQFVWYNYTLRKWTVVDDEFTPIDTLTQSFPDEDDYHDVHLFDDSTYIVVMLQKLEMDLSSMGGLAESEVLNPYMVHLDQNENVLQEWSGLDHLPLDPSIDNLLWPTVDYLHWNSVQFDVHGGLLLSFRNRSQIVRLRPEDWSVHWKLGGVETNSKSPTLTGMGSMCSMTCTTLETAHFVV